MVVTGLFGKMTPVAALLLVWPKKLCQSAPMKVCTLLALALVITGTAAIAEMPLSGAQFDAYTSGKTLTFMEGGQPYGVEQYRPGRRVKWAFDDGDCQDGEWYEPETGLICFIYEGSPNGPQCWNFFKKGNGLMARFASEPDGTELYEARQSPAPLLCLGPDVGV